MEPMHRAGIGRLPCPCGAHQQGPATFHIMQLQLQPAGVLFFELEGQLQPAACRYREAAREGRASAQQSRVASPCWTAIHLLMGLVKYGDGWMEPAINSILGLGRRQSHNSLQHHLSLPKKSKHWRGYGPCGLCLHF